MTTLKLAGFLFGWLVYVVLGWLWFFVVVVLVVLFVCFVGAFVFFFFNNSILTVHVVSRTISPVY